MSVRLCFLCSQNYFSFYGPLRQRTAKKKGALMTVIILFEDSNHENIITLWTVHQHDKWQLER
jgi:hypothetical protein